MDIRLMDDEQLRDYICMQDRMIKNLQDALGQRDAIIGALKRLKSNEIKRLDDITEKTWSSSGNEGVTNIG